jgi:hypothetical protein
MLLSEGKACVYFRHLFLLWALLRSFLVMDKRLRFFIIPDCSY